MMERMISCHENDRMKRRAARRPMTTKKITQKMTRLRWISWVPLFLLLLCVNAFIDFDDYSIFGILVLVNAAEPVEPQYQQLHQLQQLQDPQDDPSPKRKNNDNDEDGGNIFSRFFMMKMKKKNTKNGINHDNSKDDTTTRTSTSSTSDRSILLLNEEDTTADENVNAVTTARRMLQELQQQQSEIMNDMNDKLNQLLERQERVISQNVDDNSLVQLQQRQLLLNISESVVKISNKIVEEDAKEKETVSLLSQLLQRNKSEQTAMKDKKEKDESYSNEQQQILGEIQILRTTLIDAVHNWTKYQQEYRQQQSSSSSTGSSSTGSSSPRSSSSSLLVEGDDKNYYIVLGEKNQLQRQYNELHEKYENFIINRSLRLQKYLKANLDIAVQQKVNQIVDPIVFETTMTIDLYTDTIDSLQKNIRIYNTTSERTINVLSDKYNDLNTSMTNTLHELKEQYNNTLNELLNDIGIIQSNYMNVSNQYTTLQQNCNEQSVSCNTTIQKYTNDYHELQMQHDKTVQTLMEEYKMNEYNMQLQYATTIQQLNDTYEINMHEVLLRYDTTIQELNDTYETNHRNLNHKYNTDTSLLQNKLENVTNLYQDAVTKINESTVGIDILSDRYNMATQSLLYWETMYQERSYLNITYILNDIVTKLYHQYNTTSTAIIPKVKNHYLFQKLIVEQYKIIHQHPITRLMQYTYNACVKYYIQLVLTDYIYPLYNTYVTSSIVPFIDTTIASTTTKYDVLLKTMIAYQNQIYNDIRTMKHYTTTRFNTLWYNVSNHRFTLEIIYFYDDVHSIINDVIIPKLATLYETNYLCQFIVETYEDKKKNQCLACSTNYYHDDNSLEHILSNNNIFESIDELMNSSCHYPKESILYTIQFIFYGILFYYLGTKTVRFLYKLLIRPCCYVVFNICIVLPVIILVRIYYAIIFIIVGNSNLNNNTILIVRGRQQLHQDGGSNNDSTGCSNTSGGVVASPKANQKSGGGNDGIDNLDHTEELTVISSPAPTITSTTMGNT